MTATAIETDTLQGLDFEISCQATHHLILMPGKPKVGECNVTATHLATIHSMLGCKWIEKFLCTAHANNGYRDACPDCCEQPRIRDCKHIGGAQ